MPVEDPLPSNISQRLWWWTIFREFAFLHIPVFNIKKKKKVEKEERNNVKIKKVKESTAYM